MGSSAPSAPWGDFTQDPRTPQAAPLRASDRDRDVVLGVLTEGYADGRLTKDEYDERAGATTAAKTLGDLPALIADLVPERTIVVEDLHRRAVERWEAHRRQALTGFLIPSLICWAIWVITGLRENGGGVEWHFPWPLFVMLGTAANLMRVLLNRQTIIAEEQHHLEKKQREALGG